MSEKQYGAFALNVQTLAQHRMGRDVKYVPGSFVVEKVMALDEDAFLALAGNLTADYVFLEKNRERMSADPGDRFNCLLARTQTGKEGILFALQDSDLYTAYARNVDQIHIDPLTPVEWIRLSSLPCFQTDAIFYHKPRGVEDLTGVDYVHGNAERRDRFVVEKIVVLPDREFTAFQRDRLLCDEIFLFDNLELMRFDPAARVWHCLLVKGETSRDGILVESEGYSYARYAAYVRNCMWLRLRDIPIQYERPAIPPREKTSQRRSRGGER